MSSSNRSCPSETDFPGVVNTVAAAALAHGAASFGTLVLCLVPLVREYHLGFVSERFPDLLPRYERAHLETTARPDYLAPMGRRVSAIRECRGFGNDTMAGRPSMHPSSTDTGLTVRRTQLPMGLT